jgi:hypothetical protein
VSEKFITRCLAVLLGIVPSVSTATHLPCDPAAHLCIASFVPDTLQVTYDVPAPIIDLSAEEASIIFTLPVGLDPVTPGVRSVVFLNRPGGPSGPVGAPSDFVTLTAFDPQVDASGLVQLFELFFQSEGAPGFDVNVLAVQATGAPEIFSTGEFQDVSGATLLNTEPVLTILIGSEGFAPNAIPEPGTIMLFGSGLLGVVALRFVRRE